MKLPVHYVTPVKNRTPAQTRTSKALRRRAHTYPTRMFTPLFTPEQTHINIVH
jgi:hypothetical protein